MQNNETTKRIGGIISEIREKRGLTQSKLAELLNTSQSAVARMEKGEQNFTTDTLSKVSKVLRNKAKQREAKGRKVKVKGDKAKQGNVKGNKGKDNEGKGKGTESKAKQPNNTLKHSRIEVYQTNTLNTAECNFTMLFTYFVLFRKAS